MPYYFSVAHMITKYSKLPELLTDNTIITDSYNNRFLPPWSSLCCPHKLRFVILTSTKFSHKSPWFNINILVLISQTALLVQ